MEIVIIMVILIFLLMIAGMIGEAIIVFITGLILVVMLPLTAFFKWIFSDKEVKKDRRDQPTVWRRKR